MQFKLATRFRAAEPGAGAKTRLTKTETKSGGGWEEVDGRQGRSAYRIEIVSETALSKPSSPRSTFGVRC